MKPGGGAVLTSVKPGALRRPVFIAAGGAALAVLAAVNVTALVQGLEAPWLLAGAIVGDMVVIGTGIVAAVREVLRAEGRTEESQARLGAIVDSAMDAVITIDEAQRIVLFNRAAEQTFGCRRDEALGQPLDRFLPQRFRGAHRDHVHRFGQTGVTSRRMGDHTTLWAVRANGEEFPIEASISQATEEGARFLTVILRDITRRKQAEDELRRQQAGLRALSAQVLEAREEEKTRIARELHDELGQLLTALKMDLAWLRERAVAAAPELGAKADAMAEVLDRTVGSVRRIAADLRPLMLDDLGLADAAQWLVDDFARRSGVNAQIEAPADGGLERLERPVANTLYRALQESLTNISRHAQAKNAWVTLEVAGGRVQLEVEDDGRGFAPEDLAKTRSLGLKGMRERALHAGGTLEIARAARGGTRLRLSVPLAGGDRAPA